MAASTHDQDVFSFYSGGRFCNGFEEVLSRYREIVPNLKLAGLNCILLVQCFSFGYLFRINHSDPVAYCHCCNVPGPTSFAPVIEMAMSIVEQSGGQYHVLLIIADGQVFASTVNINSL